MALLNDEMSAKLTSVNKVESVLKEASELLSSGKKLIKEEKYDEGIDQLSDALALAVETFGELDSKNSVYYIEYGKALLSQGDMLTNMVKQQQLEGERVEEQSDEKEPLPVKSPIGGENGISDKPAMETSVAVPIQAVHCTEERSKAESGGATVAQSQTADSAVKDNNEEAQSTEGKTTEADSAAENRELAWQLFETARVIIANDEQKDAKIKALQLGEIHNLLGEVALGGGNFDKGYEEFSTSIKLLGKSLQLSDPKIGRAQQLAGLCAVHGQQLEAAQFHYTAAAENHNMRLEELLIGAGAMEQKNPEEPESADIEFVERKYLDILKEKAGEESDLYKNCMEIFGIINDLIDRVEEMMEEEELKKAEVAKVMQVFAEKMKSGGIPGLETLKANGSTVVKSKADGPVVIEQCGFDSSNQPAGSEVKKLGTFGGKVKRKSKSVESVSKKIRTV